MTTAFSVKKKRDSTILSSFNSVISITILPIWP